MSSTATFIILPSNSHQTLEHMVCQTIEKNHSDRQRIHVLCPSLAQANHYSHLLWSFHESAFIPHTDDPEVFMQSPFVLLTHHIEANINANFIINLNTEPVTHAHQHRHIIEFVGSDPADRQLRRNHFKHYQSLNMEVTSMTIPES